MDELEPLLMSNLRGQKVICHARPELTVSYVGDLDSGVFLHWPLMKAILSGLPDPDAVVKDWLFTCESGDFLHGGKPHSFGVAKGAYAVREREVKRFRFETREAEPWPQKRRDDFQEAWRLALNRLVDTLQS